MWIKASGTWLAHARERDIMAPVAMKPLLDAVHTSDPRADRAQEFAIAELNPSGLRPSIETTVHGLMPHPVVVHVHCVDTVALAVRTDCEAQLGERLEGIKWALVPYARPGLPLALAIDARLASKPDVLVLANHGLVVAANTVSEAEALLEKVKARLAARPRTTAAPDLSALETLADGSEYRLPADPVTHGVALDGWATEIARRGSLYPDHVIFLGETSVIAEPSETAAAVVKRIGKAPAAIIFPGVGVLMRKDINAGGGAMARCLADVALRIPVDAPIHYLSEEDQDQLTNWDAEKYRQKLNRAASA